MGKDVPDFLEVPSLQLLLQKEAGMGGKEAGRLESLWESRREPMWSLAVWPEIDGALGLEGNMGRAW